MQDRPRQDQLNLLNMWLGFKLKAFLRIFIRSIVRKFSELVICLADTNNKVVKMLSDLAFEFNASETLFLRFVHINS